MKRILRGIGILFICTLLCIPFLLADCHSRHTTLRSEYDSLKVKVQSLVVQKMDLMQENDNLSNQFKIVCDILEQDIRANNILLCKKTKINDLLQLAKDAGPIFKRLL
jgi:hypothetical protein